IFRDASTEIGIEIRRAPLFSERCIFKESETVALLVSDVFGDYAMEAFIPVCVLINKAVGCCLIAFVLDLQHFGQELSNHIVILIVMNAKPAILKSEQAIFQKEIPLHQLHCVVGLIATWFVVLQYSQYSTRINGSKGLFRIVSLIV